jgi:heme exporter protein D
MDAIDAFLAMGGYARFVWPCYGLAAVAMLGLLAASLRAARSRESELDRLQQLRRDRPSRRRAVAGLASEESRS